jgi:hypothetical protein
MIDLEFIVLLGALASIAVLAVAPVVAVYVVAFVILTPILGVALWLLIGGLRGARMPLFSQRGVMQTLERRQQSDLAIRLGAMMLAPLGAIKPRRLEAQLQSSSDDAAQADCMTHGDSAAQP